MSDLVRLILFLEGMDLETSRNSIPKKSSFSDSCRVGGCGIKCRRHDYIIDLIINELPHALQMGVFEDNYALSHSK